MIEKCLNITILDFSNFDNLLQKGQFFWYKTTLSWQDHRKSVSTFLRFLDNQLTDSVEL